MSSQNIDDASIPKPIWIERFYEDNAHEEDNASVMGPIMLISQPGRNFVWKFCEMLIGAPDDEGITGQTCLLYERYFRHCIYNDLGVPISDERWNIFKSEFFYKTPLIIAICCQLVTKTQSATEYLRSRTLQRILAGIGFEFTIAHINKTEAEVFRSLRYRIPLWTNVEKAQMVAQTLHCSKLLKGAVGYFMNLVDYNRQFIQDGVARIVLAVSPSLCHLYMVPQGAGYHLYRPKDNIRCMLLVAGVLDACWRYFCVDAPSPVPQLAIWMETSELFIHTISKVILQQIMCVENEKDIEPFRVSGNLNVGMIVKKVDTK